MVHGGKDEEKKTGRRHTLGKTIRRSLRTEWTAPTSRSQRSSLYSTDETTPGVVGQEVGGESEERSLVELLKPAAAAHSDDEAKTAVWQTADTQVRLRGAANSRGTTCYIDSLLVALFGAHGSFDGLLYTRELGSSDATQLQALCRLVVNYLRAGDVVDAWMVEEVRSQLIRCGWQQEGGDAHAQHDASELYMFLAEKLQMPYLPLEMRIVHGADYEAADSRTVTHRMIELALPDEGERPLLLQELLESYFFDNRIESLERMLRDSNSAAQTPVAVHTNAWAMLAMHPFYTPQNEAADHASALLAAEYPSDAPVVVPLLLKRYSVDRHGAVRRSSRRVIAPMVLDITNIVSEGGGVAMNMQDSKGVPPPAAPMQAVVRHDEAFAETLPPPYEQRATFRLVLRSVVCHKGANANAGHYVTFCTRLRQPFPAEVAQRRTHADRAPILRARTVSPKDTLSATNPPPRRTDILPRHTDILPQRSDTFSHNNGLPPPLPPRNPGGRLLNRRHSWAQPVAASSTCPWSSANNSTPDAGIGELLRFDDMDIAHDRVQYFSSPDGARHCMDEISHDGYLLFYALQRVEDEVNPTAHNYSASYAMDDLASALQSSEPPGPRAFEDVAMRWQNIRRDSLASPIGPLPSRKLLLGINTVLPVQHPPLPPTHIAHQHLHSVNETRSITSQATIATRSYPIYNSRNERLSQRRKTDDNVFFLQGCRTEGHRTRNPGTPGTVVSQGSAGQNFSPGLELHSLNDEALEALFLAASGNTQQQQRLPADLDTDYLLTSLSNNCPDTTNNETPNTLFDSFFTEDYYSPERQLQMEPLNTTNNSILPTGLMHAYTTPACSSTQAPSATLSFASVPCTPALSGGFFSGSSALLDSALFSSAYQSYFNTPNLAYVSPGSNGAAHTRDSSSGDTMLFAPLDEIRGKEHQTLLTDELLLQLSASDPDFRQTLVHALVNRINPSITYTPIADPTATLQAQTQALDVSDFLPQQLSTSEPLASVQTSPEDDLLLSLLSPQLNDSPCAAATVLAPADVFMTPLLPVSDVTPEQVSPSASASLTTTAAGSPEHRGSKRTHEDSEIADSAPRKHAATARQFYCDVCNRGFTRQYNMRTHRLTHEPKSVAARPFCCAHCPRSFTRKHDLERHQVLHDDSDAFKCRVCKRGFARMDVLERHANAVHRDVAVSHAS
ncbi:hypothetical protein H4S08_000845 [Coemansia sp. RSA 1365]|nr:hypothetical protein H4S08_000845 [Coemansia sp. RSA 1365]